jgi:predicted kinase
MGQELESVTPAPLELVVLVGLQGSGKSTFRRERLDDTHVVVSKDLFRNNPRPARRQVFLIDEALSAGRSVVVDNCNVTLEDRRLLIEQARRYQARVVCYYFPPDLDACHARNALREGKARVPDAAIQRFARWFVEPTREEGFDELFVVQTRENCHEVVLDETTSDGDG